jgi:2-methylisocitrate lyase-like PEP mutase family enzyme
LVLANIWDAGSAKLVEAAGFSAVATTSAGVAEALGYGDHQHAPADEMLAAVARITRAVSVPVTVDAEAGYGLSADELVGRLLAAGAVGCNLEDTDHLAGGRTDPGRQAEWLASVRAAADATGVRLVINARIDDLIQAYGAGGPVDESTLVAPMVARAKAYLAAGADCVYPILLHEPASVRAFVAAVAPASVNIMTTYEWMTPKEAGELGVARVSTAAGLWRAGQTALADRLAVLAAN